MFRVLLSLVVAAPLLGAQTVWTLDREPAVSVPASAPDGTPQFSVATWAARLPSGEIAIADGPDGMIRIAGADGRVTRSLGRSGAGPGEFRMLTWVGSCGGDSLYAWDRRVARMSVFHATNGYARQMGVPRANGSFAAACSASGSFAVITMPDQQGPTKADAAGTTSDGGPYEVRRMTASVLVLDAGGEQLAEVRHVLWGEFIAGRVRSGGGLAVLPRPLGGASSFSFAGGRLAIARTDSGRVDVHNASGARVGRFAVHGRDDAPSDAQYERAIGPAIALTPTARHEVLTAFAKSVPPPERLPAFSRILADSSGLIWMVMSLDGDPITRLSARRSTGEVVGTLEIPFVVTLFEVGTDYILGRTENADGEQHVVLYRYTR